MAESEEELKSLLMKVKEKSEKYGLKVDIQKTEIIASSPITTWQIDGKTMETVTDLIFLGSKISVDSDSSQEIKRCFLLGRKGMINLDSILKSRGIILPTKVCQSYGFSSRHVQMWKLDHKEAWVLKNWCFQVVVLENPLDCKEIKTINPKGNHPEYSLEGLKLKLQYFGHQMWTADSLEKTLMLEKTRQKKETAKDEMVR